MSSSTAKYVIPFPVVGDAVNQEPATLAALAARLDLLLGEAGFNSTAATAATQFNVPVTLSRTYPGNVGASTPGIVVIQNVAAIGTSGTIQYWVDTFTGTASTITGFTIHGMSSTTTTRSISWRFLPVL